jgi:hypothetical protein
LYFLNKKRLLITLLVLIRFITAFSQHEPVVPDTLIIRKDTAVVDTLLMKIRKPSPNAVDAKVTYRAGGHIKRDLVNKRVILIETGVVNYGDIEITADSMIFNMKSNLLFAAGRKDTSGVVKGTPKFKEGSQEFEAEELTYNFKKKSIY